VRRLERIEFRLDYHDKRRKFVIVSLNQGFQQRLHGMPQEKWCNASFRWRGRVWWINSRWGFNTLRVNPLRVRADRIGWRARLGSRRHKFEVPNRA
jgi:hypothetical protein